MFESRAINNHEQHIISVGKATSKAMFNNSTNYYKIKTTQDQNNGCQNYYAHVKHQQKMHHLYMTGTMQL